MKCTRIWLRKSFKGANKIKRTKEELTFLYATLSLYLIYAITKYYQMSQTVWELWPAQDFGFRGDKYMSLPNIIKASQRVWELWPAQEFSFRVDKHIKKKVRVIYLARGKPTGPLLYPYQI